MNNSIRITVPLGELIAAAFDRAAMFNTDQREVSRLAAMTVMQILQRAQCRPAPRR